MTLKIDGNGIISPLTNIRPTGEFAYFMLPAAPSGWIVGNGSTIGSPTSGATRANADTFALFSAWWAYTDAQLPIYNVLGNLSSRGANMQADWDAGKRLAVFDLTDDRFPVSANGTTLNGTKYADQFQGHALGITSGIGTVLGAAYTGVIVGQYSGTEGMSSRGMYAQGPLSDGTNGTPRTGTKTLPPRIGMLGCFKL